jgi:threonine aldolase
LLGKKEFIAKARRIRKIFGGGMRQAGILAAAGIYALDNNVNRLAEDHANAAIIAKALENKDFVEDILPVETNIIIAKISGRFTSAALSAKLKENNILAIAISPTQMRFVLHLDITTAMVNYVADVITAL